MVTGSLVTQTQSAQPVSPPDQSALQRSSLILDLAQIALEAPDVPSAVTPMLTTLVSGTAAVGSAYFQIGGAVYHARAAAGKMPEGPIMEAIAAHGLPAETPLMVALQHASSPLFFDDTRTSPESAGFPDLGVASLAAAPVRDSGGALLGAFLMHTFERHSWTSSESELFGAMSGVLANLAARLVAEENAVAAREDALRALGMAVEYRDGETKGHTDRVTELALRVGAAFDLGTDDMTALRWGAYLHDIGKIGIPDNILLKPGKLTDEEWLTMRRHSEMGHAFAGLLGFLPAGSLETILYHHERWDGGGYPEGRPTGEIPLTARIFSICDVYDALTSDRPYKQAWSHADAVAEIVAQRGKQFDPAVVDMFVRVVAPAHEFKND